MKSQTFKKLMTIFLSTAITFSIAGIPHALCLGDPSASDSTRINEKNADGKTPLMQALKDHDVNKVRELLSAGARLDIPYTYRDKEGHPIDINPMEYLGSFLSEFYDDESYRYLEMSEKIRRDDIECCRILLEHCVTKNIKLHVNPNLFIPRKNPDDDYYVWSAGLSDVFDRYMARRPDLFSRELAVHEIHPKEPFFKDELKYYCIGLGYSLIPFSYIHIDKQLDKYVQEHQPKFPWNSPTNKREYLRGFFEWFIAQYPPDTFAKKPTPETTPESSRKSTPESSRKSTPESSRESTPCSSSESTPYSSPESTPYSNPELTSMPEPEESEPLSTPELGCLEIPEL